MPRVSKKTTIESETMERIEGENLEPHADEHSDETNGTSPGKSTGRKRTAPGTSRPRSRKGETEAEPTERLPPSPEVLATLTQQQLREVTEQAVLQAETLRQQFRQAAEHLEDFRRQTEEVRGEFLSLRAERDQLALELAAMRQQARTLQEQFRQEAFEDAQRARKEISATEALLGEIKRLFEQSGRQFLRSLETQTDEMKHQMQQARIFLKEVPTEVESFRSHLSELAERLPDAEGQLQDVGQALESTRQGVLETEEDARQARERLDTIRCETAEAEERLSRVKEESQAAERRLGELHEQIERVNRTVSQTSEKVEPASQGLSGIAAGMVRLGQLPAPAPEPVPEPRNRLGVTAAAGVVVAEVTPGSPAAEAGLARGDVITAVRTIPVFNGPELRDRIAAVPEGQPLTLHLTRGGLPVEVTVTLVPLREGESAESRASLGLTVEPGVVVAEVLKDSPAAAADLAPGDVITAVNGAPVPTAEQLRDAILPLVEGAEVLVTARRAGEERNVKIHLDTPAPAQSA